MSENPSFRSHRSKRSVRRSGHAIVLLALEAYVSSVSERVVPTRGPSAIWERIGPLLRPRRTLVAALAIASLLAGFIESALLALVARAAAALVARSTRLELPLGPLHIHSTVGDLIILAGILAVARILMQALLAFLPARLASDVQFDLRTQVFGGFISASWPAQSRDPEGYTQEMATNHVEQSTLGVLHAAELVGEVCTFAAMIASAIVINVVAAAGVLTAAIGVFLLLRPLGAVGIRSAGLLSRASIDYATAASESVRMAEETQVLGVAAAHEGRMQALAQVAKNFSYRARFVGLLVGNLYQSAIYLFVVVGLAGLYATRSGDLASLGAVILILVRAGGYGQLVQQSYQATMQAMPYLGGLQDATSRYLSSRTHPGTRTLPAISMLEFDDVTFAYEQARPVLSHISFQITAGETIGIVGPSGAGKSTMVQILLGLRTPDTGHYLVNGIPADEYVPDDWHRAVSYLPQEPRLLHASVRENIRYLRDIDDASIETAARLAGIHGDIMGFESRYDTVVGPRADAISGGQQQRLCLARALAARPHLLVLDEPTSALDPQSEALIQQSLSNLQQHVTVIIVAHRMSTLDICDKVMVISSGELEAFNTLSVLRLTNRYYRRATASGAASGPVDNP